MTWWQAMLLVMVVWRVTRIMVVERFPPAEKLREWVLDTFGTFDSEGTLTGGKRWGLAGWSIAYLWTCMWCMSIWVGAALYGLQAWVGAGWLLPVGVVAAASGFTGLVATVEDVAGQVEAALKRWHP